LSLINTAAQKWHHFLLFQFQRTIWNCSRWSDSMAKELIEPQRFVELANFEIEAHRLFRPGMRISLGASLPNGSYEIVYHGTRTERVATEVRYKLMSMYEVRPFPLF
jgi:hypothetical protein